MLLKRQYTFTRPKRSLGILECPVEFTLEGGRSVEITESGDASWHMSITGQVEVGDLRLIEDSGWRKEDDSGVERPVPAIQVSSANASETAVLARSVASALTYLLDKPVRFSTRSHEDEFVPENSDDEALLESWNTRSTHNPWSISVSGGSVTGRVNADDIARILPQQAGLRLYEEALMADVSTARFRDLWRVLESAFSKTDQALIDLMVAYPPLLELGVDAAELKKLLVLRGRASHAQSKAGLREVTLVERDCRALLARLKTIVERVIDTKSSWGYPTNGHEERLITGRRVPDTERDINRGDGIVVG